MKIQRFVLHRCGDSMIIYKDMEVEIFVKAVLEIT